MRRHGCATGPTPKTRGRARRWRRSRSAPISLAGCASSSRSVCSPRRGRSPEGSSTPGVRAIRSSRCCTCAIHRVLRTACSWIRTRWMRKGWARTDLYLLDRAHPERGLVTVMEGVDAIASGGPEHGVLWLRTNLDAPRYRIVAAPCESPQTQSWRTIVPEGEHVIEAFGTTRDRT